ncbi:MAG: 50S ribosomal protein L24 [Candidatus Doudnabacteria bacterium CG10_big_fil_rev_8_21_14_0_10_42_18]|uniref:Large ribosomal subunit protein uL24 n=1 Tax=Candidatus Doudnabacteria bacterium CG10_big_fil_rev_8_21_14_0_10_42_18 TaxID=1974552 RepID=A0A2H0VBG5_9BACT|nr:MAG: 50S ribosomal protein L24 [Candidatus Doudnabacteria bacterium CG10_big_fil_rev_8_21_14_0_10_42_18]
MHKLKIKKGDTVKVLSGKDKGKTGKVLRVFPKMRKVMVEDVNLHTRFQKSKKTGQPSQKIVFPSPIDTSKLMLMDSSSGKPSRIGYIFLENGSKQRVAKVSGKAV